MTNVARARPPRARHDTVGTAERASGADAITSVKAGLTAQRFDELARRFAIPEADLRAAARVSEATLVASRVTNRRLSRDVSDRVSRVARLLEHATQVFGSVDRAGQWMLTPGVPALGGERPLDLLDTDPGAHEVETVLTRIMFGVYS